MELTPPPCQPQTNAAVEKRRLGGEGRAGKDPLSMEEKKGGAKRGGRGEILTRFGDFKKSPAVPPMACSNHPIRRKLRVGVPPPLHLQSLLPHPLYKFLDLPMYLISRLWALLQYIVSSLEFCLFKKNLFHYSPIFNLQIV